MTYMAWKHLHLMFVLLTFVSFSLRGMLMLAGSSWLYRKPVRVVPHVIDTCLLISAIGLALSISQYPFTHAWLTAKVLGLLVYIALGTIALKRGRTKSVRALALGGALATFIYIVAVARTHSASLGFF